MVSKHTFAYCIAWKTTLQMYAISTTSVRQWTAWQQAMNFSVSNTWHEAQFQSWNKVPKTKTEVTHGHSVRDCWYGLQEGCGDDSLPLLNCHMISTSLLQGQDATKNNQLAGQSTIPNKQVQVVKLLLEVTPLWMMYW